VSFYKNVMSIKNKEILLNIDTFEKEDENKDYLSVRDALQAPSCISLNDNRVYIYNK
ncbi:hypothetical protein JKY79_01730, partial [Candidatus Babeliales bacterium]|nr:hypothetical protein [Candidatus Babeliales bacterium]